MATKTASYAGPLPRTPPRSASPVRLVAPDAPKKHCQPRPPVPAVILGLPFSLRLEMAELLDHSLTPQGLAAILCARVTDLGVRYELTTTCIQRNNLVLPAALVNVADRTADAYKHQVVAWFVQTYKQI